MFIINSLCCVSQSPEQNSSNKSKAIKKITPDCPISNFNNPQFAKPTQTAQNQKQVSKVTFDLDKSCLAKSQTLGQSFQSNECNAGSDKNSINEDGSQKYVSPASINKSLEPKKQNEVVSLGHEKIYVSDFNDTPIKQWSIKDVLKFLGRIGLKKYYSVFYENKIKGKDLVSLTEKELREDLLMHQKDIKALADQIQLLKQKVQREKKEKSFSRTFGGHRRKLSFSKPYNSTYSCKKILSLVKNPILQEESEEQNGKHHRRHIYTTKDIYSTTNFSELISD